MSGCDGESGCMCPECWPLDEIAPVQSYLDHLRQKSTVDEIARLTAERDALRQENERCYGVDGLIAQAQVERDQARARVADLEAALRDCIETAEEGWGYAPEYFQDKWDSKGQIAKARAALAQQGEGEPWRHFKPEGSCPMPWCYAMPECTVCHLRKPPRGRNVPVEAANGYCGPDCEGYYAEPRSGHLWPGEAP